jgi:hypothetical protein
MSNAIFERPDLNVLSGLTLHSGDKDEPDEIATEDTTQHNLWHNPKLRRPSRFDGTVAGEEKESQGQWAGQRVASVRRGLSDTAIFYLARMGDQGFMFIWRGNGAK